MSTIAELRKQDANICQALLKATQEMQQFSAQIAALPDPKTANLDTFEQLKITCEAIQEYLIRHREKLQACLAHQAVPAQAALPAVPDLSLENLSLAVGDEDKPRFSFENGASSIAPPRFSLTPATPATTAPTLTGNRLSLLSTSQPSSTSYLTLSGKSPLNGLRLSLQNDTAK
jgi:hypothetical protein